MSAANKTPLAWLVAAAAVATGSTACSMILDFDENRRPCAPDSDDADSVGDCLDGYSCLVNECIENGSVQEGETCWVNAHCEPGHVCTTAPFACRRSCNNLAYGDSTTCPKGTACVRKTDSNGRVLGACVPNLCATSADCRPADIRVTPVCLPVTPDVRVCEVDCSVNCTSGVCSGDCGLDGDKQQLACQPIGMSGELACILEGTAKHGQPCNFVDTLCDSQNACMMTGDGSSGTCMAYCDIDEADPAAACSPWDDLVTLSAAECAQVPGTSFAVCGNIPAELMPNSGGD